MVKSVLTVMLLCGVAGADTAKKPKAVLAGKVTIGKPKSGPPDLASVMNRASNTLVGCYRKALAASPNLRLEATAMFAIAPSGRVETTVVMGVEDTAVEKCLVDAITKLRFAKPKDGKKVEAEVPLAFDPAAPQSLEDAFGGLIGDTEINGGFGYGRTGFGSGGGGTGWGTIGTGKYGTIGHGSGTGSGYGVGAGRPRPAFATVSIGQPTTTGGDLDKAIIRRYIKRNIQKLLYCYEKESIVDKTLGGGTLTAQFTIGGDGLVSVASASGINKNVETCVAGVIKAIEFPKPRDQTAVGVTYPLTFAPPTKTP